MPAAPSPAAAANPAHPHEWPNPPSSPTPAGGGGGSAGYIAATAAGGGGGGAENSGVRRPPPPADAEMRVKRQCLRQTLRHRLQCEGRAPPPLAAGEEFGLFGGGGGGRGAAAPASSGPSSFASTPSSPSTAAASPATTTAASMSIAAVAAAAAGGSGSLGHSSPTHGGFQVCCSPATMPASACYFRVDSATTPARFPACTPSPSPAWGQGQRPGDFYGQSPGSPVDYSVFDGFRPRCCDHGGYSGISQGYSGYHLGPYSAGRAVHDSLAVQGTKLRSESSDAA